MRLSRISGSLALAILAIAALGAMTSGSANAATAWGYCNRPVPAHTACPDGLGGTSIYLNMAHYAGRGTVRVCERVVTMEGPNTISRRCDNNTADSQGDLAAYPVAMKAATVGNDSPWTHTINGIVWTP